MRFLKREWRIVVIARVKLLYVCDGNYIVGRKQHIHSNEELTR